jgi:NDP-sugar pyrophosphorylase family protein
MFPVAILAGGLATRLRPVTEKIPKSLVEIAGEPFLWHQLRLLRANGIERVVLCVGHLGERIRESIGNGEAFGLRVGYSFDGPALLGTAGALKQALPLLGGPFFVLYGDSYLPCDWAAAQRTFEQSGKLALMSVFLNEGRWDTSNVEFEDGRLLAYSKKNRTPRMRYIDYGLGILRPEALDGVPAATPTDLATVYEELLSRGELAAYESPVRFYETGSFAGIEEFHSYLTAIQGAP